MKLIGFLPNGCKITQFFIKHCINPVAPDTDQNQALKRGFQHAIAYGDGLNGPRVEEDEVGVMVQRLCVDVCPMKFQQKAPKAVLLVGGKGKIH